MAAAALEAEKVAAAEAQKLKSKVHPDIAESLFGLGEVLLLRGYSGPPDSDTDGTCITTACLRVHIHLCMYIYRHAYRDIHIFIYACIYSFPTHLFIHSPHSSFHPFVHAGVQGSLEQTTGGAVGRDLEKEKAFAEEEERRIKAEQEATALELAAIGEAGDDASVGSQGSQLSKASKSSKASRTSQSTAKTKGSVKSICSGGSVSKKDKGDKDSGEDSPAQQKSKKVKVSY